MPTYLLTWNPEESPDDGPVLNRFAAEIAAGNSPQSQWSAGNTQTIEPDARVFLLRQGRYAHGLIGSGSVVQGSHPGPHRNPAQAAQGRQSLWVQVQWDNVVPAFELPSTTLRNGILPSSILRVGASGAQVPQNLCANLETAWATHLASIRQPPNVTISAVTFDRQFSAFKSQIQTSSGQPFISFYEGKAAEEEGYKGPLHNKALRLLNVSTWAQAAVGSGKILRHLIQAIEIKENNLDLSGSVL